MIEKFELDLIPQMLEQGKLTKEEAVMRVLGEIYTNPGRFNLLDMEEDARSDFLMSSLQKFEGIIGRYDKKMGPLGAYIFYSLPGIRLSWEKKMRVELAGKRIIKRNLRNLYEIALEKNERLSAEKTEEGSVKVSDACSEKVDEPLVFKRILGRRSNLLEPKSVFYKRRAAFVLALKSAWYLDDSSLKKICDYCDLPQDEVFKTARKIKKSLVERSEKRAQIEEKRDKAWFFICRYREQLAALKPSSDDFKTVKRKLDYQLNSWKNKTKILQSYQMTLSPRNKDLAKMLKIKAYRISVFLNYARKMAASGETLFPESLDT